jgi:integrase
LNRKEARAILQSIAAEPNPHWRAYFVLLLMLGRRRGELLSAEWKEIDLESDEPSWRLPRTKAGRVELVELPPQAVAILKGLSSEDHSPFVFPGTGERGHLREPKRAWARILERAKVNDVRLHDLRRTVGKWLRRSGASLQAVSLVLGHSQITTTSKHYTSLDREDRRETLERMATMLLEALPDEPTPDARE